MNIVKALINNSAIVATEKKSTKPKYYDDFDMTYLQIEEMESIYQKMLENNEEITLKILLDRLKNETWKFTDSRIIIQHAMTLVHDNV